MQIELPLRPERKVILGDLLRVLSCKKRALSDSLRIFWDKQMVQ